MYLDMTCTTMILVEHMCSWDKWWHQDWMIQRDTCTRDYKDHQLFLPAVSLNQLDSNNRLNNSPTESKGQFRCNTYQEGTGCIEVMWPHPRRRYLWGKNPTLERIPIPRDNKIQGDMTQWVHSNLWSNNFLRGTCLKGLPKAAGCTNILLGKGYTQLKHRLSSSCREDKE